MRMDMTDTSIFTTTTTKHRAARLSYLDANAIHLKSVCGNNEGQHRKQHTTSKTIQKHLQSYFKKRNEKINQEPLKLEQETAQYGLHWFSLVWVILCRAIFSLVSAIIHSAHGFWESWHWANHPGEKYSAGDARESISSLSTRACFFLQASSNLLQTPSQTFFFYSPAPFLLV